MSTLEVDKIKPQSGTNTQLGESGDTITIPAGATITNNGTANGFGSADTEKVKVSSNDTTAGFLNGKLVAGTNISLTEGNDGGNETLTAALSGTVNNARLTGSGAITINGASVALGGSTTVQGKFESQLLHVRDEKSASSDGGGTTGGSVMTRDLNTVVTNEITGASLGSNQITLPSGTYYIEAYAPGYACNKHRLFLYNTTDSSYTIMGSTGYARTTNAHQTESKLMGRFTIAAQKVFDLRQYFGSTQSGSGMGVSEDQSRTEYYANAQIWKVS